MIDRKCKIKVWIGYMNMCLIRKSISLVLPIGWWMWHLRAKVIESNLLMWIRYLWGRWGNNKRILFKLGMPITRSEILDRGRHEGRVHWESAGEIAFKAIPKKWRGLQKEEMLWRTLRKAKDFCKITQAQSDGGAKNTFCNNLAVHWVTGILEQLIKGHQEINVALAMDHIRATAMIKPRSCKCFLVKK